MTPNAITDLQASLYRDLTAFLPEVVVCGTIVILLLIRLFGRFDRVHLGSIALILTLYALYVSACQWLGAGFDPRQSDFRIFHPKSLNAFGGMLVFDNFLIFIRLFLYGFAALMIWLSMLTGIPDREDSADFYVLLLGATVGMAMMASANHLMMVFIG